MKCLFSKSKLLKSKVFSRMFFSYILVISLFFSAYSVFAFFQYYTAHRENLRQEYQLKAESVRNALDLELLSAQHIVSSINGSATLRNLHSAAVLENTPVNSYLLYQGLQELKSIRTASNNYRVCNVMLLFKDYNRAYAASAVIHLENGYDPGKNQPFLKKGRLRDLLGESSVGEILFNNEYVIYGDEYTYSTSQKEKGSVLVIFDEKYLERYLEKLAGQCGGFRVFFDDEPVVEIGEAEGNCFQAVSSINSSVRCEVYVDFGLFPMGFDGPLVSALTVGFLLSAGFAVFAYFQSSRYYSPIGSMEKMITDGQTEGAKAVRQDEFDIILRGIQSLIGENNGYREQMIHISPYAKQGILHGILNGNMEQDSLRILIDEDYIDLKRSFFTLALTNIVYQGEESPLRQKDAAAVVEGVCRKLSSEEMQIDCYARDPGNIFLIVNSDEPIPLEDMFYRLHEEICREIDDKNCLVTIGVGQVEDDIGRLSQACRDAMGALDGMLTGGRDAVYFYDPAKEEGKGEYYFPKDAQGRLLKAFKERNTEELHAFLDELYEKNTRDYDPSPETVRLMVDELHLLTLNVFKSINAFQAAAVRIDKIEHAATLEEIFTYYRAIYETACNRLEDHLPPEKDVEKLDRDILACIDENYKNPDLSLAMLCEKFGVSNKYISMVCKNLLGKTYLQYVQEKRVLYAAELLRTTKMSMEEIAAECGYSNALTFRRNFKSIMNVNPGDYR